MEGIVSQFAGIYRERTPHASLRGHVRCLWINDLSGSRNECLQVVPDGCVDIVWTGGPLCIAGPDTRPILARMPCGAVVVGERFHPLDRVRGFQRFSRLAARPEKHNLADMATRAGYADQAHMTREVRRMSGITAGEFVAQAQGRLADSFKTAVAGHV